MSYTVEDEYGDVKLATDDFTEACRLAELNDWWVYDSATGTHALYAREDDELT